MFNLKDLDPSGKKYLYISTSKTWDSDFSKKYLNQSCLIDGSENLDRSQNLRTENS